MTPNQIAELYRAIYRMHMERMRGSFDKEGLYVALRDK